MDWIDGLRALAGLVAAVFVYTVVDDAIGLEGFVETAIVVGGALVLTDVLFFAVRKYGLLERE